MPNKNQSFNWIQQSAKTKVFVDEKIKDVSNPIRGVYGIFIQDKNGKSECAYIGRADSIYGRMFYSNGHISMLKNKNHYASKLNKSMDDDTKTIHIKILQEVPLILDNYHKDTHRLAFAEYYWISFYQEIDQCLEQLPEGKNISEADWTKKRNQDL